MRRHGICQKQMLICDAPVTVLAVKDRVTGNNPCAAIYGADGYFKNTFGEKIR